MQGACAPTPNPPPSSSFFFFFALLRCIGSRAWVEACLAPGSGGTNGFMLQRAVIQNIQWDAFRIATEPRPSNEGAAQIKDAAYLYPRGCIMAWQRAANKPFIYFIYPPNPPPRINKPACIPDMPVLDVRHILSMHRPLCLKVSPIPARLDTIQAVGEIQFLLKGT